MDQRVLIAGGKTGGHLFPGIAIAQALGRINNKIGILFVGTDSEFETSTLAKYGFGHKSITSRPIKGSNIFKKIFSVAIIGISILQSLMIIKSYKPDFVIGVGGFSSFAVVVSAWLLRIPTGIQEQNSIPGITNRLLAKFVKIIFTSFKNTKGFSQTKNTILAGNPVRRTQNSFDNEKAESLSKENDRFTILVTGGSQGAQSINQAFLDALSIMPDTKELAIIHQTGKGHELKIQEAYQKLGITCEVRAFFQNMPEYLKMADLVVCRAGAGTISEITLYGLPSILIPYPHAADDHQTANAVSLVKSGAAIMIDDKNINGNTLKEAISKLIGNKEQLKTMAKASRDLAMENADEIIAREIIKNMKERN